MTIDPAIEPLDVTRMLGQHFLLIMALWVFVFFYFAIWRFLVCSVLTWRRPNFLSAVLGFNALGWIVAILRDARWMSKIVAEVLYSAALSFGVLAVIVICANEAARTKPWSRRREW